MFVVFDEETERLEADIAETCGVLNAAEGRLVRLIAEGLATELWGRYGVHTPEQWVAWQCGVAPGRARQLVALAKRVDHLPTCAAALQAGEVSIDQAGAIARLAPAWADHEATELAKNLTVSQLTRTLRRYAFDPDEPESEPTEESAEPAPEPEPVAEAEEHRVVRFGPIGEYRWQAFIDLPLDEAAGFETALATARDDLFRQRHPDPDSTEARIQEIAWADALALVAERSLAAGAVERPSSDRYQIYFHYDIDPVGHPVFGPHGLPALPDCLRRLWTCDGVVKPITEIGGVPVNAGRSQHIVPRRLRRLIEHRDGGCVVPGCDRARWVQVHHIIHWEDDGVTDTWNLCCLCSYHHRLHHLELLGIEGNADDPDGLTFTDRHGRVLAGSGRPAPPNQPLTDAAGQLDLPIGDWHHPLGERLQSDAVYFNPPPHLRSKPPERKAS